MLQRLRSVGVCACILVLLAPVTYAAPRTPTPSETMMKEASIRVALGSSHSCHVGRDGKVRCWGNGDAVASGFTNVDRVTPIEVSSLSASIVAIAAGAFHTCAVDVSGSLSCWGANSEGQLGDTTKVARSLPVEVANSRYFGFVAVAAGSRHTCALRTDGQVMCWGKSSLGQLGDGFVEALTFPVSVARGVGDAVAITAGGDHSCALLATSTVFCWGDNRSGQLGIGTTGFERFPVQVLRLSDVVSVSAGLQHTCALRVNGTVSCWGSNSFGALGTGTTTDQLSPGVSVSGLTNAIAIASGDHHTCALLADGATRCWGNNADGQIGDGSITPQRTPVQVRDVSDAVAIAAGGQHTCVLRVDGAARCWGANRRGQLGDGTTTGRLTAVPVRDILGSHLSQGVTGGALHTCAARDNGTAACWGDNSEGQIGDSTTVQRVTPIAVSNLTNVAGISNGFLHSCARVANGTVRCWGDNRSGQLGDNSTVDRATPVPVGVNGGLRNVSALTSGHFHNCVIRSTGGVACWGENAVGQLGDGTTVDRLTPVNVAIAGVKAVAAGYQHTCAVLIAGTVQCWGGNNSGQLGTGGLTNSSVPVPVQGVTSAVAIAAGAEHTCALLANGAVQCWGANFLGQLGNGNTVMQLLRVAVHDISDAVAIAAGDLHTCALTVHGGARCWGANYSGQLGDGTTTDRPTPVVVRRVFTEGTPRGLRGVARIALGASTTCAQLAHGETRCWGLNLNGQIGDGTTTDRLIPAPVLTFAP